MNSKNQNWKKKLNYKFDTYIAKGFWAQFGLLFLAIAVIVLVFGFIATLLTSKMSAGSAFWQALLHMIDQGTIGGDEVDEKGYVFLMLVVTFLGMAFTGTIVGIINNAMGDKLEELRKGHSQIIEKNHIVVIGFDENIHTILSEIEESNENNKGRNVVVVIDEKEKTDMEFIVEEHKRTHSTSKTDTNRNASGKKNKTEVIFRSGSSVSQNTYEIASLEKAGAIIINKDDDFDVIRVILALVAYFKKHGIYKNDEMPSIVALMHEKENVSAAEIAAGVYHENESEQGEEWEKKIRILYFENILAHIFAQVCRQPGLSHVISEIFDYDNSEIYIEDVTADGRKLDQVIAGKSFREVSMALNNSIAVGIQRNGLPEVNPNPDITFEPGDKLIHLALDDREIEFDFTRIPDTGIPAKKELTRRENPHHFVILGWNTPLPEIIQNIDDYVEAGSTMEILSMAQYIDTELSFSFRGVGRRVTGNIGHTKNISVKRRIMDPYNWAKVKNYLDVRFSKDGYNVPTNIVIMCQDGVDKVEADEKATVLLLNIREYLKKHNLNDTVNVTTEMNLPEDQELLLDSTSNDFVVGSEIANRMLVQVANDPCIYSVFKELLTDSGSEIYLKDFSEYVDTESEFTFAYIQQVAINGIMLGDGKQEVVLGWIEPETSEDDAPIHLNPSLEDRLKNFSEIIGEKSIEKFKLVVLSMD